ncbi:MAG: hypothetical protein PHU46_02810 [Rhodocyclaceae bacterium]|nr:hypothetical protein [Rhodocyclaceae bacterium]
MIRISKEQMDRLDESYFYGRLRRFVTSRCRNPQFIHWLGAQAPEYAGWAAAWPAVRGLSEHDCALVLVFLAVCEHQGVAAGPVRALIGHLAQHEVGIKRFLSERGYFRFSDFEFADPGAPGPVAAE